MISNFFIWCAGSDKSILSKCSDSERIKHIGFGTLVLIPAILATISMSFVLSTLANVERYPIIFYMGGILWGSIIFSFDRFIVSTHRRKPYNREELNNPAFYIRLFFALILGFIISHPITLFYFDGSIQEKIRDNVSKQRETISNTYDTKINKLQTQINDIKIITLEKERKRDEQAKLVAGEIDGAVLKNATGEKATTGIKGDGTSAKFKRNQYDILSSELILSKNNDSVEIINLNKELLRVQIQKDNALNVYTPALDYLKKVTTLEEIKLQYNVVSITQWMLIIFFIILDIAPVIFKTFSPFGMYDKILLDDTTLIKELDTTSRKQVLQDAYNKINSIYAEEKELNKKPSRKQQFDTVLKRFSITRNIAIGLFIGIVIILIILIWDNTIFNQAIFTIVGLSSFLFGLLANALVEFIKYLVHRNYNE